jgi:hypothetical protein
MCALVRPTGLDEATAPQIHFHSTYLSCSTADLHYLTPSYVETGDVAQIFVRTACQCIKMFCRSNTFAATGSGALTSQKMDSLPLLSIAAGACASANAESPRKLTTTRSCHVNCNLKMFDSIILDSLCENAMARVDDDGDDEWKRPGVLLSYLTQEIVLCFINILFLR